jgi:Tfp pilus assembly protein PilN
MVDINLLPGQEAEERPTGKFLTWILTYGRYIIIGTEIIVFMVLIARFKLDRELTDLHQSIDQKQAVILSAAETEKQVRSMQNRLAVIKTLVDQREVPPKLLAAFEKLTPQDVYLTDLSFDAKKLSLSATALSNTAFNTFLNNLSASSYFSDISLDSIGKGKTGAELNFRISASLENL